LFLRNIIFVLMEIGLWTIEKSPLVLDSIAKITVFFFTLRNSKLLTNANFLSNLQNKSAVKF